MPKITDPPPKKVASELRKLRLALDDEIPSKQLDYNILIATWNLRAFGGLTEKWVSGDKDSPKRNLHALLCIAEIVSRFDVIALQEVKGNIKSLRHMMKLIGPNWSLILTDVTRGKKGNDERMAFLFDTRKVKLSGLACELVVPEDRSIKSNAFNRQFARTPYAVGFQSAGHTFILVTLHVIYGKKPGDRVRELQAIGKWLADWATDVNAWDQDLITLGDFNIDREDDPLFEAFTSTGLRAPDDLDRVPRTIFSTPEKPETNKHYDQIAWFTGEENKPKLSFECNRAGYFDFTKVVMTTISKQELSWRISDHYPLWVEFLVR
ncbi:endonuclease/exonuclease/phosphatase family protein [Desulfobacterota bacterium AH_259_B03_O07]|nr:endonuclease/exonuclease/phosphatase family protein [Desulfobacterota bacterium AH_259_B03_O07]